MAPEITFVSAWSYLTEIRRHGRGARATLVLILLLAFCCPLRAENIVETSGGATTRPIQLTDADVDAVVLWPLHWTEPPNTDLWVKLDKYVSRTLDDLPLKPFHCALGISGHETHFDHPDRLFFAVGLMFEELSPWTVEKVWKVLDPVFDATPPYGIDGFDPMAGKPRESYDVPETLRPRKPSKARSALGVYSTWLYLKMSGDHIEKHFPAIKRRMADLIEKEYVFDPTKTNYVNDEAQKLNGDIAGLIGHARLAARMKDDAEVKRARARLKQLLELRINLERVNPNILEKSHGASKSLHNNKLARYSDLTPELAIALRKHTDGLAAQRLRQFRAERNGWYLAFGERMIGGENYISPPHMAHAMFLGAAWIEQLEPGTMAQFIDVPWCKGDLYYIEKLAVALRGLPKQ